MSQKQLHVAFVALEGEGNLLLQRELLNLEGWGIEATVIALQSRGSPSAPYPGLRPNLPPLVVFLPTSPGEQSLMGKLATDLMTRGHKGHRVSAQLVHWRAPELLLQEWPGLDGLLQLRAPDGLIPMIQALGGGTSPLELPGICWRLPEGKCGSRPVDPPTDVWTHHGLFRKSSDRKAGLTACSLLTSVACTAGCPHCAASLPKEIGISDRALWVHRLSSEIEREYERGTRLFVLHSPDILGIDAQLEPGWAELLVKRLRKLKLDEARFAIKMQSDQVSKELIDTLLPAGLVWVDLRHRWRLPDEVGATTPARMSMLSSALNVLEKSNISRSLQYLAWEPGPSLEALQDLLDVLRDHQPLAFRWVWLPSHSTLLTPADGEYLKDSRASLREPHGRRELERQPLDREPHGREELERQPLDRQPLDRQPLGREVLGPERLDPGAGLLHAVASRGSRLFHAYHGPFAELSELLFVRELVRKLPPETLEERVPSGQLEAIDRVIKGASSLLLKQSERLVEVAQWRKLEHGTGREELSADMSRWLAENEGLLQDVTLARARLEEVLHPAEGEERKRGYLPLRWTSTGHEACWNDSPLDGFGRRLAAAAAVGVAPGVGPGVAAGAGGAAVMVASPGMAAGVPGLGRPATPGAPAVPKAAVAAAAVAAAAVGVAAAAAAAGGEEEEAEETEPEEDKAAAAAAEEAEEPAEEEAPPEEKTAAAAAAPAAAPSVAPDMPSAPDAEEAPDADAQAEEPAAEEEKDKKAAAAAAAAPAAPAAAKAAEKAKDAEKAAKKAEEAAPEEEHGEEAAKAKADEPDKAAARAKGGEEKAAEEAPEEQAAKKDAGEEKAAARAAAPAEESKEAQEEKAAEEEEPAEKRDEEKQTQGEEKKEETKEEEEEEKEEEEKAAEEGAQEKTKKEKEADKGEKKEPKKATAEPKKQKKSQKEIEEEKKREEEAAKKEAKRAAAALAAAEEVDRAAQKALKEQQEAEKKNKEKAEKEKKDKGKKDKPDKDKAPAPDKPEEEEEDAFEFEGELGKLLQDAQDKVKEASKAALEAASDKTGDKAKKMMPLAATAVAALVAAAEALEKTPPEPEEPPPFEMKPKKKKDKKKKDQKKDDKERDRDKPDRPARDEERDDRPTGPEDPPDRDGPPEGPDREGLPERDRTPHKTRAPGHSRPPRRPPRPPKKPRQRPKRERRPRPDSPRDPRPRSRPAPLTLPALNLSAPSIPSIFATLVKLNFMSKFIMVPTMFDPSMLVKFRPDDPMFKIGNLAQLAMSLIKCPSPFKIHIDTAVKIGKQYESFIEDVSRGIILSWNLCALTTKFSGVLINGPIGMLMPGGMIPGPTMKSIIMTVMGIPWGVKPGLDNLLAMGQGFKMAKAINDGLEQGFNAWAQAYMNMAIPFPSGAACVGSMIPAPNVPIPLITGSSAAESMVSSDTLKGLMLAAHGPPGNHGEALFDSFAKAFNIMHTLWKATNLIMLVLGAGGAAPAPTPGPVAGATGNGGLILGMPVL